MGVSHPGTGKWYTYVMLLMGTRASPAVAGRFGAGFIRTVIKGHPSFQGQPQQNNFASDLQGTQYDVSLGTGRVEVGPEGLGVNLLFMHVDDIFLHGPTCKKVHEGLNHLMDTTMRLPTGQN